MDPLDRVNEIQTLLLQFSEYSPEQMRIFGEEQAQLLAELGSSVVEQNGVYQRKEEHE